MGRTRTDEFRQDAVRIALTSGLTRKQVASDLGIGMSTLNKWITAHRDTDVVSKEVLSLSQENDRLRRENRILKEEREILKKATQFFAGQKPLGLGSLRNTALASQPSGCVMSWTSAHVVCGHSAAALPAAGSDLIWSRLRTSRNSPASAWVVMVGQG